MTIHYKAQGFQDNIPVQENLLAGNLLEYNTNGKVQKNNTASNKIVRFIALNTLGKEEDDLVDSSKDESVQVLFLQSGDVVNIRLENGNATTAYGTYLKPNTDGSVEPSADRTNSVAIAIQTQSSQASGTEKLVKAIIL